MWFTLAYLMALNLVFLFHPAFGQQAPTQPDKTAAQSAEREDDAVEQRRMWRTFKKQRRSAAARGTKATPKSASPGKSSNAGDSETGEDAFVGFTVWEMRPSESGTERRSFRLRKPNGQSVVLRPFRLGSEAPLVADRSYVFGIESARTGYLYVIDREEHKGGVLGDPLLLFPTKDVMNKITAGNVVEIPDQKAESAYFEAERNGPDHIGEALTIIVSPEPLIDRSRLKDEPITLQVDEVKNWERQWAKKTRWAEDADKVGRAYTEEEGRAGSDPSYKLKEGDPLPQRLYQVGAKPGTPLMVTLQLRYSEAASPK